MIMKIIDPHLHLFTLELGDYHWLKVDNPPFWPDKSLINKSFTEADLNLTEPYSLSGFIHIEAGFDNEQPWRELENLENNCQKPFRAIATIDLTTSCRHVNDVLNKLTELASFVGVRHLLDEQAMALLNNKQVLDNINLLNNFSALNHNTLVFETQLSLIERAPIEALSAVINSNPNILFIINHAGFPPTNTKTDTWKSWQNNLLKLSIFPHVAIKCSGWEMTQRAYSIDWVSKSLSVILSLFGEKRVMLASNFPLCLLSNHNYQAYWQTLLSSDFYQSLTEQEKSALCYDNALYWYSLSDNV